MKSAALLGWALATPGGAVATVRAEIEIDAPAERIFDILTDLPAYSEWNPFTPRVERMSHRRRGVMPGSASQKCSSL